MAVFLFLVSQASALDTAQMIPISCKKAVEKDSLKIRGRIQTKCGSGNFCLTQAECFYVDRKILETEYNNDPYRAFRGEGYIGTQIRSFFEKNGGNPRHYTSEVNIACYSENSDTCPPLLECLKMKNVLDGTLKHSKYESDEEGTIPPLYPNLPQRATH